MAKVVIYQRRGLPLDEAIDNALEKAKKEGIKDPIILLSPRTQTELEKEYTYRLLIMEVFGTLTATFFVENRSYQTIYVHCDIEIKENTIVVYEGRKQEAAN